jgi:AraC-like DNA-binding protein
MTYGSLGLTVLTSSNVAQGLAVLKNFQLLTYSLMRYEVVHEDEKPVGIVACDKNAPDDLKEFLHERALGSVTCFLQDMQQGSFPLTHIDSVLDRPPNWQNCDVLLGATVRFNADKTSWHFAPSAGDLPLPLGCPFLEETYRQQCMKLIGERRYGNNFLSRVYEAVVKLHRDQPTSEKVAELLHISVRTLHRRLSQHDTSFSDVLNHVRGESAKELLEQTELPIEGIAVILGYAEAASFSRAFKSWIGISPSAYRSKAKR